MPFLHWDEQGTQRRRALLLRWAEKNYAEEKIPALRFQNDGNELTEDANGEELTEDEKLMLFYLKGDPPIQRRTLNQSYYYMLESTKNRDDDQVISRHMKENFRNEAPRLIMVDQLWLWIVEGGQYS